MHRSAYHDSYNFKKHRQSYKNDEAIACENVSDKDIKTILYYRTKRYLLELYFNFNVWNIKVQWEHCSKTIHPYTQLGASPKYNKLLIYNGFQIRHFKNLQNIFALKLDSQKLDSNNP